MPSRSTWSRNDCSSLVASTSSSTGDAPIASWSATVTPSISSITSTRRVDSAWYTNGAATPSSSCDVLEEDGAARGFGAVVELLLERGDQLLGQPLHAELARRLDPTVEDARGHPEHRGVAVHDVFDAGALHLHHHVLAGLEHGAMRLADRRCRERLEVERGELLLDGRAQLRLSITSRTASASIGRADDWSSEPVRS